MKETRKRVSRKPLKGKKLQPYVLPEAEIREFVGSLGVREVSTVAARFQIVADLTSAAFEENRNELGESELMLIRRLSDEEDSEHYRRIMRAIIIGVGQGRHGINAAHLTASRIIELAFRWTSDYFSALDNYRDKLSRHWLRLGESHSRATRAGDRSRDAKRTVMSIEHGQRE